MGACGEDVVEATEPDVVSPAISPDDPMRRCHQHVLGVSDMKFTT